MQVCREVLQDKMKVLFVVSGIGYGDATREHANIVEFKKNFPHAQIMVASYDNGYEYFKNKYRTIKIQGYKLPGNAMKINIISFGLKNLFLPAYWFISMLKVRLKAFNFVPDLIVSDFEPAGISLARVLRKKCVIVFGFDPLLYREYAKKHNVGYKMKVEASYFEKLYDQADIVVMPTFKKKREKHLLYNYVDPIIRVKPEDLPAENILMKQLGLKKKPIILMLGGSNFGEKLAKNLNKIAQDYSKEEFIVFGGDLGFDMNENVKYIKYSSDFLKYLKVSKGVVTLAGQKTLSEALIYGKPVLCFPIQDHVEQILNAYALEDTVLVGYDSSLTAFRNKFKEFMLRLPEFTRKSKNLKLKNNGSEEFVKLLKSILP